MGLFDFVGDLLGLSPPTPGEAMSKEDLAWLMEKGIRANQIDQQGIFTGSRYTGGEGTGEPRTQTTVVNPALQSALDRMIGGLGEPQAYQNPFQDLLGSMLAERHADRGMGAPQMPQNAVSSYPAQYPPQMGPQPGPSAPPPNVPPPNQPPAGNFGPPSNRPWVPATSWIEP